MNQYKDAWVHAYCSAFITADRGGMFPKNIINLFVFGGVYPEYFCRFFFPSEDNIQLFMLALERECEYQNISVIMKCLEVIAIWMSCNNRKRT